MISKHSEVLPSPLNSIKPMFIKCPQPILNEQLLWQSTFFGKKSALDKRPSSDAPSFTRKTDILNFSPKYILNVSKCSTCGMVIHNNDRKENF